MFRIARHNLPERVPDDQPSTALSDADPESKVPHSRASAHYTGSAPRLALMVNPIERREQGNLLRPRARYVGVPVTPLARP